jgi:hypothetical protein
MPCWANATKAVSRSISVLTFTTTRFCPSTFAAVCTPLVSDSAFGFVGFTRNPIKCACGTASCMASSCFATSALNKMLTPVMLWPGRLKLATRSNLTGSPPIKKTTGIVMLAALAESAEALSVATITSALRRTRSAVRAGNRSFWPSAQRYSIATFWPSIYPASFRA